MYQDGERTITTLYRGRRWQRERGAGRVGKYISSVARKIVEYSPVWYSGFLTAESLINNSTGRAQTSANGTSIKWRHTRRGGCVTMCDVGGRGG